MFYSCHLPKTGGTSLLHSFLTHYGDNKIFSVGHQATTPTNLAFIDLCLRKDPDQFSLADFIFVSGHWNTTKLLRFWQASAENLHTFLVIRDPVSLFWSSFYQATIEGRKPLTPEAFLARRSPIHSLRFYSEAYRDLIDGEVKESPEKFFGCIRYIIHLSNLTEGVSKIHPELETYLSQPRRVRSQITSDYQNPLQNDADFNQEVTRHLEPDIAFYQSCLAQIAEDKYHCRSFNPDLLADQVESLKSRLSAEEARAPFVKLLQTKLASVDTDNPKYSKWSSKWNEALAPYGLDLQQVINQNETKT
jgi:hypothetical protein